MEYVPLATLADQLQMDRSNLRKFAISNGFQFARVRTDESRNQLTLALPEEEAERLRRLRKQEGFNTAIAQYTGGIMLLNNGENPRRRIRKWIAEIVDGMDEVHLPTVADEVVKRIGSDFEVMRAMLFPAVYEDVRKIVGSSRGWHLAGESALSDAAMLVQAERVKSRWERWLEHAGDRHLRLMVMTRDDLLLAAQERRKRADTEVRIAKLLETMAEKMAEGQTVGEVFTTEQIDAIALSVTEDNGIPEDEG